LIILPYDGNYCWFTHFNELGFKAFHIFKSKDENWHYKLGGRGGMCNKYEGLWAKDYENILKLATWMSLNLKNVFKCHTISSKAFWKKEKVKASKLKGTFKILIPSSWAQNPTKGEKLRSRP
jgi:hypothetical protein